MTAKDMKIKVFSLIEEYYPDATVLAEDDDVKYKINGVINEIQMDLMKYKRIDAVTTITLTSSSSHTIDLKTTLTNLYQINRIDLDDDVEYEMPNDVTLVLPDDYEGSFKIYYYKYPTLMTLSFATESEAATYDTTYTFDLEPDLLEVMPYGVASDLLKMDMISNYGQYFKAEYDTRKSQLDTRRTKGIIKIDGGVEI